MNAATIQARVQAQLAAARREDCFISALELSRLEARIEARLRTRDTQRSRVYDWETTLFERTSLDTPLSLAECQRLVDRWAKSYGIEPIRVTDGRGCCWRSKDRTIRLASHGRVSWMVAHEFAHARVTHDFSRGTVAAHGPEFVFRYLELLVEQFGQDWAALVDSLAAAGIEVE